MTLLVNRRRRRNLPAELKVEIVDCLPLENAVHFLANVPNRLIIHHCAPRIRRIFEKKLYKIAADYARTLLAANSNDNIVLWNEHKYTPEMDIFLRYGAAHCDSFWIFCHDFLSFPGFPFTWHNTSDGFLGYPANFFDDLIKHRHETKEPTKAVNRVNIQFPLTNPAPWPTMLVQPCAGEMKLEEESKVDDNYGKFVRYILRNKHNPDIVFKLGISFKGNAKCYQQMTGFEMFMMNVQSVGARK